MSDPGRMVILGAGPTGLGCAYRLHELGIERVRVIEARDHPGGLASSVTDAKGFLWDIGGHVGFSRYPYYSAMADRAVAGGWINHRRRAYVRIKNRLVPYPFQHNLHHLDATDRDRILAGLQQVSEQPPCSANLRDWALAAFGAPIAELFLLPYNAKVWGYPPEELGTQWIGERVAPARPEPTWMSVRAKEDRVDWGPNRVFRFPRFGGTGALWRGVAGLLPSSFVRYGLAVTGIDTVQRCVYTATGKAFPYDRLISTIPLPCLTAMCRGLSPEIGHAAARLKHSAVHIVGFGLQAGRAPFLERTSWIYFPEPDVPFHRATVLSNYSPANVPSLADAWSLMVEVTETSHRPVDPENLPAVAIAGLRKAGLVHDGARILSVWQTREEFGYPTPTTDRDDQLKRILPALEAQRIFSRGRFGAWRYEVSNQDHSFMQGVELADRLVRGTPERVLNQDEGREKTLTPVTSA